MVVAVLKMVLIMKIIMLDHKVKCNAMTCSRYKGLRMPPGIGIENQQGTYNTLNPTTNYYCD